MSSYSIIYDMESYYGQPVGRPKQREVSASCSGRCDRLVLPLTAFVKSTRSFEVCDPLREPLPCNAAVETALQTLFWCCRD